MPQATDELRSLMKKWFGGELDDGPPYEFLRSRGWIEMGGVFRKPTPSYTPSVYEEACLLFLRDEWDYDWEYPLYETVFDLCSELEA